MSLKGHGSIAMCFFFKFPSLEPENQSLGTSLDLLLKLLGTSLESLKMLLRTSLELLFELLGMSLELLFELLGTSLELLFKLLWTSLEDSRDGFQHVDICFSQNGQG